MAAFHTKIVTKLEPNPEMNKLGERKVSEHDEEEKIESHTHTKKLLPELSGENFEFMHFRASVGKMVILTAVARSVRQVETADALCKCLERISVIQAENHTTCEELRDRLPISIVAKGSIFGSFSGTPSVFSLQA